MFSDRGGHAQPSLWPDMSSVHGPLYSSRRRLSSEPRRILQLPILFGLFDEHIPVRPWISSDKYRYLTVQMLFRATLNMSFSHRWRNVGFLVAYIMFNVRFCFYHALCFVLMLISPCRYSFYTQACTSSGSDLGIPSVPSWPAVRKSRFRHNTPVAATIAICM